MNEVKDVEMKDIEAVTSKNLKKRWYKDVRFWITIGVAIGIAVVGWIYFP